MGEDDSTEIEQPKRKKRGRPRKQSPGVEVSQYFKTKSSPIVAEVASDLDRPKIATDCWRNKSYKEKRRHYRLTCKLKGFVTHCTAIPVESWEAFRVDHRNSCGLCGLIIEEVDTLRKHIQEHIFLKCLLCSSSFNLLDSFTSHMQQHTSTMSVLPCSSAVVNDKSGRESYFFRNRESDKTLTSVQSEKEVVQESVVAQNEIGDHGPTAVLVCNAPCALNFDETFPETNLLEVEVMTGQQSSSFDGLQVGETPSHPHTEKSVNNTGPTGSHCGILPINHSVPASVNPLVCTVCNFQSKSAETLGENNLQCHNLYSCICQGSFSKDNVDKNGSGDRATITMEKFSPNSEMSDPRIEISGVDDHASYCRPVNEVQNNNEIIYIDSGPSLPVISDQRSINENIETIICDGSSDSCVVFFGNPSQKCMLNPMKPLTCHFKPAVDEVGMQRNKISSVNCTRANNEPVKTPISFATLNLKVDDPLNLLNDNGGSGRFFETVVVDDFVGGVLEVLEDRSISKTLEVSRKTKESGEKYKVDETVSELSLDEPSAKKRKSDDGFSSRETESSPQKSRSRNSSGRVSNKELKSLFYGSPESFEGVCNTPVTGRVTRHSVSSSEKSDPSRKTLDSTSNQSVGNSKKSKKNNSSKVSYSTRLYKEKGCNVPKAAKINIELLNSEPNRQNEKISKVPSAVISGEDFKSSSWIEKSTSRKAASRANGRKWKKLMEATEASRSENCDHHRPARAANDKDLSKTPPANESESDILAEVTSFEVIDVRNINESTPGSYENEADVSTTCKDPLALSFEEALDVDSFCGGAETPYIRHLSSNVVQLSNSEVLFDQKKFSTKILTSKEIQMKDVPKLVDGQWIVYNCIFRRYNTNVNKVLAFSNKSFYLNLFNSEPRSELILWDKIVEDHTYFCDYRHGNHTTIPVKFRPLELKSDGSYIKLDEATTETVVYKKACAKLTSPSARSGMMNDSLSIKHGKGLTKFENEGNGAGMDSEGDSTQNQEKGVSAQLGHETTYPLLGKKTGSLEDCEDDKCSVELENDTSNERWMELMNLEMEANEKLGDIEINAIETKCDASLVKPDLYIQNGNRNSNLEENATLDDEVDGEKSPVLINGTMQIMSSGRNDFKIDIPVFNKNSSNSDAGVAGSPTNIEKPSYWGFSDPETDKEEASELLMNKTIDAEKAFSVIPGTEYPDKTTAPKKSDTRKFGWSGLDKMLKEIDEIPILGENHVGKSVKSFSKKSASLPVGHSVLEDNIDTATDINTKHTTEGNIENKSHLVKKLDAPLLDHQTICKNIMKKELAICPTVLNESGEKRSVIQNPGLQPSYSSVRNTFNLSIGISCDQPRKCSSLMKENQEKRSDIQNPGPLSSCSSVNNTFDLSAGMSSDQFKKDLRQMKNVCHSQREMNLYKNYHQPICKAESMDSGSYCPNDEYGKRSVECAEFLRVKDEKCLHNVDGGSSFCDQQTIDLERLYENLQESLDRASEGDYDSSDESIYNSYCHSRSTSCSSSSFSPDCVDDIVLQASHPRGVSQHHCPDPREMQYYMSPPMRFRPLSNLTSVSREGFGSPRSTPLSPTLPRRSLRTPCHFQGRCRSSSSSPASDRSTRSSAISLSPTFSDDYDFH